MIKKIQIISTFILVSLNLLSQTIPAARRTDWSSPGYQGTLPTPTLWKDIMTFGGNKIGTADNTAAINSAISSLAGAAGVVYLPAGTFLFNSSISVPANVIIKGASSDSTTLNFNLGGATANSFNVIGSTSTTPISVSAGGFKGSTSLTLASASGINIGDYIEFRVDGAGIMFSSWANDDLAQICKVTAISGNTLTIAKPLRWHFNQSTNPRVYVLSPVQKVGFECFKITRVDTSSNQSTLINFQFAANCWVKGVEGFKTTFAHVAFNKSVHCEVTESYFHHAWSYGGDGRGYGVVLQSSSSECLVQNNIFEHLRHSMLLQSGANGNVLAYNFSTDPYWENVILNSTSDITFHGNFPFMNLAEGNIVSHIWLDDSHGLNGTHNTVFRNRAVLYGLRVSANTCDSTSFVNNEVPALAPFFTPSITLTGNGNYEYGNSKAGTANPAGTSTPPDWTSYYLSSTPSWFTTGSLPTVGYANTYNTGTVPAKTRFTAGALSRCSCPVRVAPALCSFTISHKLTTLNACCSISYLLELNPTTSATTPISYFYDNSSTAAGIGVPYKSDVIPSRNGSNITIKATDANGCVSNTLTIPLP